MRGEFQAFFIQIERNNNNPILISKITSKEKKAFHTLATDLLLFLYNVDTLHNYNGDKRQTITILVLSPKALKAISQISVPKRTAQSNMYAL